MIINCNGLKGTDHVTKFYALLDLHNPDFVVGTESKLHPDNPTYSIFPLSFTVFRNDRNVYGVFQAVKSDLACIEETGFSVNNCEIIWTSLKISNCKTLYLSSFYRPPNSSPDVLDHFSNTNNQLFTKLPNHPNIVIGGHFNLGDISWGNEVQSAYNPATSSQHNRFLQIMDDYSLNQHVKVSTRPASKKTLDVLLDRYNLF